MAPKGRPTKAKARARAADGDEKVAFKAAVQGLMVSALAIVIWDLDNVGHWFTNDTALQQALATYLVLFKFSLIAFSFSNFAVLLHHLPSRFRGPRYILGYLCILCLSGAIYYGIYVTSTSGLRVRKYVSVV